MPCVFSLDFKVKTSLLKASLRKKAEKTSGKRKAETLPDSSKAAPLATSKNTVITENPAKTSASRRFERKPKLTKD